MRFLQLLGSRIKIGFLILCFAINLSYCFTNERYTIVSICFLSISMLGYCIECAAIKTLKESEKGIEATIEMLKKCFTQKDDEKWKY